MPNNITRAEGSKKDAALEKDEHTEKLHEIFENHGQIIGMGDEYRTEVLAEVVREVLAWHKKEVDKAVAEALENHIRMQPIKAYIPVSKANPPKVPDNLDIERS